MIMIGYCLTSCDQYISFIHGESLQIINHVDISWHYVEFMVGSLDYDLKRDYYNGKKSLKIPKGSSESV